MLVCFAFFFPPFPFFFPHYWFHVIKKLEDGAGWLQQWTNGETGAGHTKCPCLRSQAQHRTMHGPEGCAGMPGCWATGTCSAPGPRTTTPAPSQQLAVSCPSPVDSFSCRIHILFPVFDLAFRNFPSLPRPTAPPEETLLSAICEAISSPNAARWK